MTACEIYLPVFFYYAHMLLGQAQGANWRGRGKSTQSQRRVTRVITEIFEKIYRLESL